MTAVISHKTAPAARSPDIEFGKTLRKTFSRQEINLPIKTTG
jgi:hypothetical protein